MKTGAASTVGTRRTNDENDVIMAGLWRYGNWRHVAMGCNDQVIYDNNIHRCAVHQATAQSQGPGLALLADHGD